MRKSECEKRKSKKIFYFEKEEGRLSARLQANMDDQTLEEDYISLSPYINLSFATESML